MRISSEMLIVVVPTPSAERKAVSGSDRYREVVQEPPESLARGMFPKGLSRNRRELPISSPKGRYATPRVDRRGCGWIGSSRRNQ